jgi:hypothetical protein
MFKYERHLAVAMGLAIIIIVATIVTVVLEIPLPFFDKG